jgi:hypothetical protein
LNEVISLLIGFVQTHPTELVSLVSAVSATAGALLSKIIDYKLSKKKLSIETLLHNHEKIQIILQGICKTTTASKVSLIKVTNSGENLLKSEGALYATVVHEFCDTNQLSTKHQWQKKVVSNYYKENIVYPLIKDKAKIIVNVGKVEDSDLRTDLISTESKAVILELVDYSNNKTLWFLFVEFKESISGYYLEPSTKDVELAKLRTFLRIATTDIKTILKQME